MYIPHPETLSTRTLYSERGPLTKGSFSLDTSGMASFFGGDAAVAAMTTLHLNPTRRWLGWYNSPGTYEVARRYSKFCKSRLLEGLFPGVPTDLAALLGMANMKGAKYIGAQNGAILDETGPFSAVLVKDCMQTTQSVHKVEGRKTQPVEVTIRKLDHSIPDGGKAQLRTTIYSPFIAVLPILVSFGTAAACAKLGDWVCFSMIALGVLVNGISCLVIGSAEFTFHCPVPSLDASGDGILVSEKDKHFVVLKGSEKAVNTITRGAFTLAFKSEPKCKDIKYCSISLVLQLIVQLLFIPQGSLFGQIMFISSLAASWSYNLWLSSRDREKIQREVFVRGVLQSPKSTKFIFGTRTTAVVFMLLVLQPKDHAKIMDMLLPNDTPGWRKFKARLLSQIRDGQEFRFDASWREDPAVADEKNVLELLCQDAEAAYRGYQKYRSPS
ncbi:hypothetical protein SCLCIDRAFT_1221220 [Scleroderma citrinum Foug A]|uniref:Uncharacterized protein n=1 Tax=Scleroderma citrinum Foug A TaxID=1036808 RepID=A0A0C2ZS25_9AGAM|nr:hypothetical protein SCLCIDRAFT_1221220 [Scleroderma citrinum Foug A]